MVYALCHHCITFLVHVLIVHVTGAHVQLRCYLLLLSCIGLNLTLLQCSMPHYRVLTFPYVISCCWINCLLHRCQRLPL